jgi:1-acyl-sn-glycerol-3-phosphate acyltransferase
MKRLALALGLLRLALHIGVGCATIACLFPFGGPVRRDRLIRWWARRLLAICRIRVRVVGPRGVSVYDPSGDPSTSTQVIDDAMRIDGSGAMLISNHISWADIFVVDTVRPARFIAKAEISTWPVVGFLTRTTRTIFIERGRRHAVRETNQRIVDALLGRDLIAMFPEGTTGDGDRLLPFHANLLQPAIEARVPIIVGGLRYLDRRGRSTIAPAYTGDTTLMESLIRILGNGPFVCELHLVDSFFGEGATRHEVARRVRVSMAQRLGFDDEAGEASDALASVMRGAGPRDTEPETENDPRDELL